MRVLFLHHLPLEQADVAIHLERWMEALEAAGHEPRLLTVDHQRHAGASQSIDRIICNPTDPAADLPLVLPDFTSSAGGSSRRAFPELTDEELALYRECLRRRLDRQIDEFDPHMIHAQHIWLWGQLALETGVPYVLSAWGAELVDYSVDARFRPLVEQAADNAGRILAHDPATFGQVSELFGAADRALLMPLVPVGADAENPASRQAFFSESLAAVYATVYEERFGRRP